MAVSQRAYLGASSDRSHPGPLAGAEGAALAKEISKQGVKHYRDDLLELHASMATTYSITLGYLTEEQRKILRQMALTYRRARRAGEGHHPARRI